MKIYPIENKEGKLHAFEFEDLNVGRARILNIVTDIPGAVLTRKPKRLFSWYREEVFCEFEINDIAFQINEPYGDNSRYWVGKKEEGGWCKELELVKQAFQASW